MPRRPGHPSWHLVKAPPGDARMLAREKRIMKLREEGHSLRAIGEKLGISGERVRQIEWSVRRRLRRAGSKN